jgi:hypothetical protein
MNNKKTRMPHFVHTPKNSKEENFIKFHLASYIVYNGQMALGVHFTTPNIHNDANTTITTIHHVFTYSLVK